MKTAVTQVNDILPNEPRIITPGAARMRASRARRRNGVRCLTIDITDSEVRRLVDLGLLKAGDEDDRCKVSLALYSFFDRSALGDVHR
jgi:hypothetical protein